MSIIKYSPIRGHFEEMERMIQEMNNQGFAPAVDVYETKNDVVVKAPLVGVDPKDIEISIENDVLMIKGEAKKESEVDEKNYYRKEIRSGSFFRSVSLPTHVIGDKAEAQSVEGMLKITIPKAPESKAKTVKIKVKNAKTKK